MDIYVRRRISTWCIAENGRNNRRTRPYRASLVHQLPLPMAEVALWIICCRQWIHQARCTPLRPIRLRGPFVTLASAHSRPSIHAYRIRSPLSRKVKNSIYRTVDDQLFLRIARLSTLNSLTGDIVAILYRGSRMYLSLVHKSLSDP